LDVRPVRADLGLDPGRAGLAAVISGHTHRPCIEHKGNVLFLNPGAAGPRRFTLPVTVARIVVRGGTLHAEIIELAV
jgi:predicted phosphodiesterase